MQPRPRIFDTFLFDGELDLLQFRLRENYDDTDVFVLVEAGETYRGEPKPFHFADTRERFAWAAAKLRTVQIRTLGTPTSTPKERAEVQRNSILLALQDASEDDLVLLLDADEVPSRSLLRRLRTEKLRQPHRLEMTRHYQRLDLLAPASTCCVDRTQPFAFASGRCDVPEWTVLTARWSGRSGVAAPIATFRTPGLTPYGLRYTGETLPVLQDAGRHLTATDPSAQLSRKLGRVFHAEWATDRGMYPPHLLRCEQHAVHHRGWWYAEKVTGRLPEDLARLAQACPAMRRTESLPAGLPRRLVRTWAWLRQWTGFSDASVRWVDDHFNRLLPLLAPFLLLADMLRWIAAKLARSPRSAAPDDGHAGH